MRMCVGNLPGNRPPIAIVPQGAPADSASWNRTTIEIRKTKMYAASEDNTLAA